MSAAIALGRLDWHFVIIPYSLPAPKFISHKLSISGHIGLVYNPFAGGLRGKRFARLERAAQIFRERGYTVEMLPTNGPNTAGDIARQAGARGAGMIVAAGGDGTINEVVSGLAHTDIPLGILPAGTANVLATEVGFSQDLEIAARQLCDSEPCRVALGKVTAGDIDALKNGRYFLMMAGAGLDAAIIYELDLSLKQKLGKLAYWHGGFRQLGRKVARFHVEVEGREHLASFVLATRVRNYGGDFEIARRIKLTDNDLEIVVFQNDHWWGYLRFFVSVVLNRLHQSRGVTIYRSTALRLSAPEDHRIYVQTDGEGIGHLPCTVEIVPDALTLMLPSKYIRA